MLHAGIYAYYHTFYGEITLSGSFYYFLNFPIACVLFSNGICADVTINLGVSTKDVELSDGVCSIAPNNYVKHAWSMHSHSTAVIINLLWHAYHMHAYWANPYQYQAENFT